MDMAIKLGMLVIFFGSMIGVGIYCRKHSTDVDGFVLGGRSVGPWLTAIYVIAGGYMATAINDFIQGIIMLVGIVAVIAAVLKGQGGFTEALNGLGKVSDPTVSDVPGIFNSFFGPDPVNLLGVVLLTSLGPPAPKKEYIDRVFSCYDKKVVVNATDAIGEPVKTEE